MPIDVTAIDRFVTEEGEEVRHLIGLRCFCHGPDGQPDPNCTQHEAGGWLYTAEQTITGLVTDISQDMQLMETGVFMPGDCVFSPLSDHKVSEGDKIIFTWPLPYGQGDARVRGTGNSERLYYTPAQGMACIDENGVFYISDVDYKFQGKDVLWKWTGKIGKAPAAGVRYSIKYMAYIEWLAFVPPVTRISNGTDLGEKVILRKKHLVEHP